ncbi:MAG: hypothetical protein U1E97_10505 [Alphaproteobacteria bacterium]
MLMAPPLRIGQHEVGQRGRGLAEKAAAPLLFEAQQRPLDRADRGLVLPIENRKLAARSAT